MKKLTFPITARAAQKLLNGDYEQKKAIMSVFYKHVPAQEFEFELYSSLAQKNLSGLVQENGKGFILFQTDPRAGRDSEKGTDEVRPQSGNPSEDSPFHGGDGNAQEVQHESQSPAVVTKKNGYPSPQADPGKPDDKSDQDGSETGEKTMSEDLDTSSEPRPVEEFADSGGFRRSEDVESGMASKNNAEINTMSQPASATDREGQELTSATNEPDDEARAEKGTDERTDGQSKNAGEEEATSEKSRYRSTKTGRASNSPNRNSGGTTPTLQNGVDSSLVNKARKVLARLVEGGESDVSPRYNWKEFCTRLLVRKNLLHARKEEEGGRPAILILPDVSGSCASFSKKSVKVAQAACKLGVPGVDVVLVSHSNGHPEEMQVNGGKIETADVAGEKFEFYKELVKSYNVKVVVALGDWDACLLYAFLSNHPNVIKLIWLDVWSSSKMDAKLDMKKFKKFSAGENFEFCVNKIRYVVGCGNEEDFLHGLEIGGLR